MALKRQQQMTQNGHGIVVCKTLRTIYTKFGTFKLITCKYLVAVPRRGPYERSSYILINTTVFIFTQNKQIMPKAFILGWVYMPFLAYRDLLRAVRPETYPYILERV